MLFPVPFLVKKSKLSENIRSAVIKKCMASNGYKAIPKTLVSVSTVCNIFKNLISMEKRQIYERRLYRLVQTVEETPPKFKDLKAELEQSGVTASGCIIHCSWKREEHYGR